MSKPYLTGSGVYGSWILSLLLFTLANTYSHHWFCKTSAVPLSEDNCLGLAERSHETQSSTTIVALLRETRAVA